MAIWPPESNAELEAAQQSFSTRIRELAEHVSSEDGGRIVTDAHIREASRVLMRGSKSPRNVAIAILRAVLELLGGGFVGAAVPVCLGVQRIDALAGVLFIAGAVMFIAAKVLEHLTEL